VDAAEEPQRHCLLIGRVELVSEESSDRSSGDDVVGHPLEEVGIERGAHAAARQLMDAHDADERWLTHVRTVPGSVRDS